MGPFCMASGWETRETDARASHLQEGRQVPSEAHSLLSLSSVPSKAQGTSVDGGSWWTVSWERTWHG